MNWQNLYLYSADDLSDILPERIQHDLTQRGYTLYDPFGEIPGLAYAQVRRLFVAPSVSVDNGYWTRILGDVNDTLAQTLSELSLCLHIGFDEQSTSVTVYRDRQTVDMEEALTLHLQEGVHFSQLQNALSAQNKPTAKDDETVPLSALPDDVQAMAQNLSSKHINKMFNKLMKQVNKQFSGDEAEARKMLSGSGVNWDSAGGQQARAVMQCLTVPAWQLPNFLTLRDAYQLHKRRERRPNVSLYPGDAEAMAAVPDALNYTPVYGGKRESENL